MISVNLGRNSKNFLGQIRNLILNCLGLKLQTSYEFALRCFFWNLPHLFFAFQLLQLQIDDNNQK